MNSFEEFRVAWLEETAHLKIKIPYLFIVTYPDKLKWDFHIEKQTQTTCLMASGGITGAGTGHRQVLCLQSEVNKVLKKSHESHVMIVTIGMVFNMAAKETSISRFFSFVKSGKFCKAHIIAKPNHKAYLHHQHIELNLNKWRELGMPDIYNRWERFERASDNFHDDYTPPWITPEGIPTIHNFTESDRAIKAFSYHMNNREELQKRNWKIITDNEIGWRDRVEIDNPYFKILMTRILNPPYYAENTEKLGRLPKEKFNLIITPAAGYSGEVFAERLDFDGDIIFYDYIKDNLEIKKSIINMNMSVEQVKQYFVGRNILYNDERLKERLKTYPKIKEAIADKYDIEYWLMDLINMDYNKLFKKIKKKRVFFDFSNIFSYHISHANYNLDHLIKKFNYIESFLKKHTEYYYIRGTRPGKQNILEDHR